MVSRNEGIAALLLNVILLPGLGTVIWGNKKTGIWQIVLSIVSFPLMLVLVGFATYFAVWVWALITGVNILKSATD